MEKTKRHAKALATIYVTPYLAEYAKKKFVLNRNNGGIIIPPSLDLYHCVWTLMQRPPLSTSGASLQPESEPAPNLPISLPSRRPSSDRGPWKDPAYYNYLSPTAARCIESELRRIFNYEFRHLMMDNEERGQGCKFSDLVDDFIRRYDLRSISSDALLKNYQRYRDRIYQRKPRRYVRRKPPRSPDCSVT